MKLVTLLKTDDLYIQKSIISKIRDLINFKNLESGDRLPSERMLSDKFGVSRASIREAIRELEYYSVLNSVPQSGTFVANIGTIAMNGIVDNMLRLVDPDFKSLVETRILLELNTVNLAAKKRTLEDLDVALNAYKIKYY